MILNLKQSDELVASASTSGDRPWLGFQPASPDPLVERLQQGDSQAFDSLVQEYSPRLQAVARRMLTHPEDAADAVQDTFLLAYVSIHRFRGGSGIFTWLYRILVNNCLMKLRARGGRKVLSLESLNRGAGHDGDRCWPIQRLAEPRENRVEQAEARALVRSCIERLPPEHRTIIQLRDIQRLSTEQAAGVLQITCGAAKTRLHRARQALRKLLEAAGGDAALFVDA